jgi:N-acetylglutamate synthase-like GNAT family acetyltransferase
MLHENLDNKCHPRYAFNHGSNHVCMLTFRMSFIIRTATTEDVPQLHELIELSIRQLSTDAYNPAQIEGSVGFVFGPDTQLIADSTYFVATPADNPNLIVGSGGWSFRKTLFGSDRAPGRVPARRDPSKEAASIRAIFVRPGFTRKGLGTQIMEHCEQAAIQAGFSKLEMGSTLTGLSLYSHCGYTRTGEEAVPLPNRESLLVVHMSKEV